MTQWEPVDPETLSTAQVVAYLRARCPWAAAHTHASLAPYLLEETYELLDAIEEYTRNPGTDTREELVGELGDVAYQVLFHAALLDQPNATPTSACPPTGNYVSPRAITEVGDRLRAKVVRRHPHVFETTGPTSIEDVERAYERIKAEEKQDARNDATEDDVTEDAHAGDNLARDACASIPASMPALARTQAVLGRLDRVDLSTGHSEDVPGTPEPADEDVTETAIGQELLAVVQKAHAHGIDAEGALRRATDALIDERGSRASTDTH